MTAIQLAIRTIGVVQYLSNEWIEAANEAVIGVAASAPTDRLIIDQHIDDHESFRVIVERNACSITALPSTGTEPAHASFRQSAATARAIAQRETDAHQAFLLGHIMFDGNVDMLIARRDAFAWLEAALASVMARTTFG